MGWKARVEQGDQLGGSSREEKNRASGVMAIPISQFFCKILIACTRKLPTTGTVLTRQVGVSAISFLFCSRLPC